MKRSVIAPVLAAVLAGEGAAARGATPQAQSNRAPECYRIQASSYELSAGESIALNVTTSDPDGDALKYSWSSDGGVVSGYERSATWYSSGVSQGYYTITVRVDDGHGHSVECSASVTVRAPASESAAAPSSASGSGLTSTRGARARRPALPSVCSGYLRNSESVPLAGAPVVDRVGHSLERLGRYRVIVFGHQEADEDEGIALLRAQAVREYLVTWRHADPSRVDARSVGAFCATGRSDRDRHVAIFVLAEGDDETGLEEYCRARR